MDSWSKGDYSQLIREASMVVEKLPVVILPSGRVPGRVLLVLPILEAAAAAEQRWDREKSSSSEGFEGRSKYMPKGGIGGASGGPGAPPARPRGVPPGQAAWSPCGSPPALLWPHGSFWNADFLYNFSGFFLAVLVMWKPEIQKQQKTETGTGVHWVNRLVQIWSKVYGSV